MNIKNHIIKLGVVFIILSLCGCEKDFLDRSLKIRRTLHDIQYQGKANLKANGMAAYKYLRQWTALGSNAMLASACDESDFANSSATVQRFNNGGWNQFTNPDEVMSWYYKGIESTFEFIENSKDFVTLLESLVLF
jgi:hypothetical protein